MHFQRPLRRLLAAALRAISAARCGAASLCARRHLSTTVLLQSVLDVQEALCTFMIIYVITRYEDI